MKYYAIMDGRAQSGTREGYESATCYQTCNSLRDARRDIKDWPIDATVWETDDKLEYPANTRMIYTMGRWMV